MITNFLLISDIYKQKYFIDFFIFCKYNNRLYRSYINSHIECNNYR